MARYVIGDIHGCVDELRRLVDGLPLVNGDVVVFLGDYIDRGPDSRGVVSYLLSLQRNHEEVKFEFLKGNHEDMLLSYLGVAGQHGDMFLMNGGKATLASYALEPGHLTPRHALSVIPSSPELRIVEREMIVFLSRRRRNLLEVERVVSDLFDGQMAELVSTYDYILFDSAPGISALTEAALRSSDVIVVPTVPDFISNLGLEAFCKTVCWSLRKGEHERKRPWVVANMVKDSPHQQMMLREMRAESEAPDGGFNMFKVEIPSELWIEEAASAGTLPSRENNLFASLAEEVLQAAVLQANAR